MTHTFKVGDEGKTREGYPYRVLSTDARGEYPVIAEILHPSGWRAHTFTSDGQHIASSECQLDLTPPKATVTVWVPLLRDDGIVFYGCAQPTRSMALDNKFEVIAVKEVTIAEGEGMDE